MSRWQVPTRHPFFRFFCRLAPTNARTSSEFQPSPGRFSYPRQNDPSLSISRLPHHSIWLRKVLGIMKTRCPEELTIVPSIPLCDFLDPLDASRTVEYSGDLFRSPSRTPSQSMHWTSFRYLPEAWSGENFFTLYIHETSSAFPHLV